METTTASSSSARELTSADFNATTTSLARTPRTSKELMMYNYRMGFFNLAANWAVLHRTKYLENAVQRGRDQVSELTELVSEQGENLSQLSEGFAEVTDAVDQQQAQVDDTLNKFREQVVRQNARIRLQQEAMQKLVASKFQTDAVVDSSIAAISGLFVGTPIVSLPVYLMTAWLPKRTQWLVAVLLKFAAFFQVASSMRQIAKDKGVHNSVGTPASYVVSAIQFIRVRTKAIMEKRRKEKESELPKGEENDWKVEEYEEGMN
jgi:hypothetical protein